MEGFKDCFGAVPDPRAANARHDFLEVIFIALAAVLCGAESCSDMADFGEAKKLLLKPMLKLQHGVPSHDTFSRVFRLLDPEAFEAAFAQFTRAFAKPLKGVVAIDGKALRGAYERGARTSPLHLVNIWAVEARLVVGQRLAPGRNEIAGALEALSLLDLTGCIVTADALHCHAETAKVIIDQGGDYVLALKDNQPGLLAKAKAIMKNRRRTSVAVTPVERGHDRIEQRSAAVVEAAALGRLHDFKGLAAVARIVARRRGASGREPNVERYFLLSTPLSAERVLDVVRSHWAIENQLHWVLDVAFNEDRARSRKDHAPRNLATVRKMALNILNSHPDKASMRRKIKRAGWDDAFLQNLLTQMRFPWPARG